MTWMILSFISHFLISRFLLWFQVISWHFDTDLPRACLCRPSWAEMLAHTSKWIGTRKRCWKKLRSYSHGSQASQHQRDLHPPYLFPSLTSHLSFPHSHLQYIVYIIWYYDMILCNIMHVYEKHSRISEIHVLHVLGPPWDHWDHWDPTEIPRPSVACLPGSPVAGCALRRRWWPRGPLEPTALPSSESSQTSRPKQSVKDSDLDVMTWKNAWITHSDVIICHIWIRMENSWIQSIFQNIFLNSTRLKDPSCKFTSKKWPKWFVPTVSSKPQGHIPTTSPAIFPIRHSH